MNPLRELRTPEEALHEARQNLQASRGGPIYRARARAAKNPKSVQEAKAFVALKSDLDSRIASVADIAKEIKATMLLGQDLPVDLPGLLKIYSNPTDPRREKVEAAIMEFERRFDPTYDIPSSELGISYTDRQSMRKQDFQAIQEYDRAKLKLPKDTYVTLENLKTWANALGIDLSKFSAGHMRKLRALIALDDFTPAQLDKMQYDPEYLSNLYDVRIATNLAETRDGNHDSYFITNASKNYTLQPPTVLYVAPKYDDVYLPWLAQVYAPELGPERYPTITQIEPTSCAATIFDTPITTDVAGNWIQYIFFTNSFGTNTFGTNYPGGDPVSGTTASPATFMPGPFLSAAGNVQNYGLGSASCVLSFVSSAVNNNGSLYTTTWFDPPNSLITTATNTGNIQLAAMGNKPYYSSGDCKNKLRFIALPRIGNIVPNLTPTTAIATSGAYIVITGAPPNATIGKMTICINTEYLPIGNSASTTTTAVPGAGPASQAAMINLLKKHPEIVYMPSEQATKFGLFLKSLSRSEYPFVMQAADDYLTGKSNIK